MASKAEDERNYAGRWIAELDASEKWQREYIVRCAQIIKRYREEREGQTTTAPEFRRYAILWSIQQTLQPAVYMRNPQPVVSRRFRDADPVARVASEVLERCLAYSMDAYDFQSRMLQVRDDYLLIARGQVWTRYVPHVQDAQARGIDTPETEGAQLTNAPQDEGLNESVVYEEALCDHVAYDDFGMEPCRSWDETGYVWRRIYLNRDQLKARFKDGAKVPLDWKPKDGEGKPLPDIEGEAVSKAAIYEIWNKPTGEAIWLSKAFPERVLDRRKDPLGLSDFFPCPRPAMGTTPPDKYIPVPDYIYYQDQAQELDQLTARIGIMVNALKVVGVYAGEQNMMLQNVFQGQDLTLVPVESMGDLKTGGGMKGIIEWFPTEMIVATLKTSFEARQAIENDVYKITGISDLLRGMGDPDATAKAEGIKEAWGSLRVRDRQKELARFARDVLAIKSEVIARKFGIDTLKQMSGVKLLTMAEKQQVEQALQAQQQLMQQAQMTGQQPPPLPNWVQEAQPLLEQPTWEEVDALLKNDALRAFRVDVETDSTIEVNEREAKASLVEGVTAMVQTMTAAGPIVQAAPYTSPIFAEIMKEITRVFRMSPQIEEIVEKVFEQAAQQPPAQGEGQAGPSPQELQLKQQEAQGKLQVDSAKLQQERERTQMEGQLGFADIQLRQQEVGLRAQEQQLKAVALSRDPRPEAVA